MAGLPAHDMAIQALSGVMGNGPDPNAVPPMPCFQAADYAPAAYALSGIMAALMKRGRTTKQVAYDLGISVKTADVHRSRSRARCDLR